jgi:Fe2+ or Zn2+ uptake regulation protein
MNYSKQHEIIYETLKKHAIHPTAEKLYEIIRREHPEKNIGIATVYRNLNRMSKVGKIKRISGLEDAEHFDHNTHPHYHFLCEKCNRVFDVSAVIAPDIVKNAEKKTGFIVKDYDVLLHGVCKDCQ